MLSQTTEYALRAMCTLAYSPDRLVSTADLAGVSKVPMNYLAKVLQLLSRAGLVTGRRGVGGGYKLARDAGEITLLEVINAIDPIERIHACPLGLENHAGALCPLHRRLDDASRTLIEMFEGVTLLDILTESGANRPLCDEHMTSRVEVTLGAVKPHAEGS